jgi:hypothetical protein
LEKEKYIYFMDSKRSFNLIIIPVVPKVPIKIIIKKKYMKTGGWEVLNERRKDEEKRKERRR